MIKNLLVVTIAIIFSFNGYSQYKNGYGGKGYNITVDANSSIRKDSETSFTVESCTADGTNYPVELETDSTIEYKVINGWPGYDNELSRYKYKTTFPPVTFSYEIRNAASDQLLLQITVIGSKNIITSIDMISSQIKNDTLRICKGQAFPSVSLQYKKLSGLFCTSPQGSSMLFEGHLFINGKRNSEYINGDKFGLNISKLNDGDLIKYVIYKRNKFLTIENVDKCRCIELVSDSIESKTIVIKFPQNKILPKPVFLNGINNICNGDTATLIRDAKIKQTSWSTSVNDTSGILKVVRNNSSGIFLISNTLTVGGCTAISDTVVVKRKKCGPAMLRGYVFEDLNKNFQYDQLTEHFLPNVKVKIENFDKIDHYVFSNAQGVYTFAYNKFSKGSIEVHTEDPDYTAGYNKGYFTLPDTSYLEISVSTSKLLNSDLSVRTEGGRHRPGFVVPLYFSILNQGKSTNSGILTITLDNAFAYSSASKPPVSINGKTLTFNTEILPTGGAETITIYATLFSGTPIGSTVTTSAFLSAAKNDENLLNNTFNNVSVVTGSFDPNDIEVNPKGIGAKGYIADTTKLDYIIRFQNVGTDTAFTVVVKNKLPNGVDFSQFAMKNASHRYELSMLGDTIVWTFKNIMLPHKGINEPKSHGLIRYKINQKTKNPVGTEIKNKAGIYFDFNAPVLTNEVLNTVDNGIITGFQEESNSDFVWLFPNPSDGHFSFQSLESGVLRIFDNVGQLIYSEQHKGKLSLDLTNLPKGIYHYKTEGDSKSAKGKIILK